MINYLKESTFAVKDVIMQAWRVTKENYFSIATLCFLIFLTASTSTFMAFFMEEVNLGIKLVMLLIFVMSYCIVELCLIKYIFKLLDTENNDIQIIETLPTRSEISRFLVATLYFGLSIFFVGNLLMPVLWLVEWVLKLLVQQGVIDGYQQVGGMIVNAAVGIGIIIIFITFSRIIFFPFFIIDRQSPPFESIKLSLAATKGNFVKVLFILLGLAAVQAIVFGFFYIVVMMIFKLLNYFWEYDINQYTSLIVVVFSSFFVVPFSTAFFAVAYRKIMSEYKGDEHPDIIHNIV
jgi:membrane-anchored glycerophosphoryl diester phosphodiesterase (GDPDase)